MNTIVIFMGDDVDMKGVVDKATDLFEDERGIQVYGATGDTAMDVLDLFQEDEQSNLFDHACRELELLGEEEETVKGYLKMIRIFCKMGHSGGSASVFIPTLHKLLCFENLKPLTNDPNEWNEVGDNTWQSQRCSDAFSMDGGKTYYRLSEGANSNSLEPLHTSEPKVA